MKKSANQQQPTASLRNNARRLHHSQKSQHSRTGKSTSSAGSHQNINNNNRTVVFFDSQDDYLDASANNENANANVYPKRLQTSSSKKFKNSSSLLRQQSSSISNQMRNISSKKKTKSDANVAMLLLNADNASGGGAVHDWINNSRASEKGSIKKVQQDNSIKSLQHMLSKQSSSMGPAREQPYEGPTSNSKSANALLSSQHQAIQHQSQGQPYGGEASQAEKDSRKSPLKKQSSLKKFDQRLYQTSYTKVFVMGDTKHGQLGFLNPNENNPSLSDEQRMSPIIAAPKLCSYNILIKQIACGEAHTHLLSQDGYVYSMGSNQYGVLGLGQGDDVLQAVTQPQLVPNLQCIVDIASGRAHTVALDVQREIYGWGRSDSGAIGLRMATPQHQSHPMPVAVNLDANDQVTQIACGLEHTCFLTADGHVFTCGEGEYGQLGLGYVSLKEYRPMRIRFKDLKPGDYVTKVACGAHHTAFLTRLKSVYTTGANNLGQLGLDSLTHQVNSPTLVESLEDQYISDIACGEGSFAITTKGDLYVWGLYNLEIYRKPFLPQALSRPVSQVSQNFYGVTGAVDVDEQAWYWHSQLDIDTQNAMRLPAYPTVIRQMKRRLVKKVVAGKDLIFALGDDVNTNQSSSTVKDSQATSNTAVGLQEIPERDERNVSSTLTHQQQIQKKEKMPALNLDKIHQVSSGSLKQHHQVHPPQQHVQIQRTPKRHQYTSSKKSKSVSRSQSRSKSRKNTQFDLRRNSNSASASRVKKARSKSPRSAKPSRTMSSHQKKKRCHRRSSSVVSRHTTSEGGVKSKTKGVVVSRSRGGSSGPVLSRSSAAGPRTRSNSQNKARMLTGTQNRVQSQHQFCVTQQSTNQQSQAAISVIKQQPVRKASKKRHPNHLEKKVEKRFQDLTLRLETDKEEVVSRLSKLCQKISKIQRETSATKLRKKKSAKMVKGGHLYSHEGQSLPELLQKRKQNTDPLGDLHYSAVDTKSQLADDQHLIVTGEHQVTHSQQPHGTVDQRPGALTIFNAEIQDELNKISQPQLIYSPKDNMVDIRSPTTSVGGGGHHHHHYGKVEPISHQPKQLRVNVSDSPPKERELRFKDTRSENSGYANANGNQQRLLRPQIEFDKPVPFRVKSPKTSTSGGVTSPKHQAMSNSLVIKSPKNVRSPNMPSYEQQLIMQLRDQIDYLERQNARLKDEKIQEQVKVSELQGRYEEARQANLKADVNQEAHMRSLESQLRTVKLERSDLAIKHADAERRVRDLENKVINLQMARNKEEDYLNQLGKSHESLRQEKNKNRDLQAQNDMLQKTMSILESTISQVKRDKEVMADENIRLKEYLQAKDIQVDVDGYRNHVDRQGESLGRESMETMERRARSLGMRTTSRCAANSSIEKAHERRDASASLLERTVEKSASRNSALRIHRRTGSQLSSYSNEMTRPAPFVADQTRNDTDIMVGGGIAAAPVREYFQAAEDTAAEQQNQYYTVHFKGDQKINSSQFGTKESKETSCFAPQQTQAQPEPPTVSRIKPLEQAHQPIRETYNDQDSNDDGERRDPRIQRLLQDAQVIQEKHQALMSTSPLRLKDPGIGRNNSMSQSHSRHESSVQEVTERAKSLNYTRMTEQTVINPNQISTPAILEQNCSQQSPLRRKSPSRMSPSSGGIRPYPCEPPSQSDQTTSYNMPSGIPTQHQTIREHHREEENYHNYDEPEPVMQAPVRDDYDADQIRQRAGISPNPFRRHTAPKTDRGSLSNFKELVREAQKAKLPGHQSFDNRREDEPQPNDYTMPSALQTRPKHDNSDYNPQRSMDGQRSKSPPKRPLDEADKDKLADQYNLKLLDNIEKLAEKAKQRQEEEPPRVNKFKRNQQHLSSNKDNSPNLRNSQNSLSPVPNRLSENTRNPGANSGLPASIFPDEKTAYQQKLRQLRDGSSPGAQQPRATSTGSNKRINAQKRPLTKEEDEFETQQMLNKPAGASKKPNWTNGLGTSAEKEKQTAQNNSFLARREALQNRLKKM